MMPLFNFEILKELAEGKSNRYAEQDVFRKFKLVAFIVHDPVEHHDLDAKIKQCFDSFDYITGQHLLCFALTEPPEMWLANARERDYFRFIESQNNDAKKYDDDQLTVLSISALLNIPMDEFPCIIVTESFKSNEFSTIKTCAENLEQQLTDLGYKATFDSDYKKIFAEQQTLDLNENIAQVIYQAVPNNLIDKSKIHHADLSTTESIKFHKTTQDTFERFCISDAVNISRLGIRKSVEYIEPTHLMPKVMRMVRRRREPLDNISAMLLEPESSTMLKTAEEVYRVLKDMEQVDYAPAAICYAKAFEKEINLSIVHWAREKLGIQLPQYYNRKQENINAFFTPNFNNNSGHPIDLNKGYKERWAPPSMGQSELVCIGLAQKEAIPSELTDAQWQSLMQAWTVIRKNRNEASHTQVMSKEKMLEIRDSMILLAENGLFENLYQIKNRLRH